MEQNTHTELNYSDRTKYSELNYSDGTKYTQWTKLFW